MAATNPSTTAIIVTTKPAAIIISPIEKGNNPVNRPYVFTHRGKIFRT